MAETKKTTPAVAKEEMVKIKLPREAGKGDEFVSVNERTWLIQRGVEVEVPACVAEVLEHSEQMLEEAYNYKSGVEK